MTYHRYHLPVKDIKENVDESPDIASQSKSVWKPIRNIVEMSIDTFLC